MIHEFAHDVLTLAASSGDTLTGVLAAAPDPGDGLAPPGSEKILKILRWAKWLFLAAAVVGGIIIATQMVLAHRRGDDAQMSKLGFWLGACVLAGVAPNIIDALA